MSNALYRASGFSQAVCDEELRQIFADSWLFIGHESEIPQAGDYVTRRMGDDDVIMCRAKSGDVRVLPNSCAHRGTQLCRSDGGDQLVLNPLREKVIRRLGPTAPSGRYGRTACEEATMPRLIGAQGIEGFALIAVVLLEFDDGPRRLVQQQNAVPPITADPVDFGQLEQRRPPSGACLGVTDGKRNRHCQLEVMWTFC